MIDPSDFCPGCNKLLGCSCREDDRDEDDEEPREFDDGIPHYEPPADLKIP